ncbi:MAG TPA: DNA repair protein RecN [Desulfobulbaceae bacterium]|nr:DNA repair protein RecN [Desulfobulbaceae bacterium]
MLLELRIENMALIDALRLDFTGHGHGLTVLTGETGAGKSIILQALHLLAGGKGAASWIRSDQERAVVEALFSVPEGQQDVESLLAEQEITHAGECIIRRIVQQSGRSRFYVNDRLVTAALVEELTENLVNIASQHDHQQLLVARRHLDFLDTFGELWGSRQAFADLYRRWRHLAGRLRDLRQAEAEKERRREMLTFALGEIEAAAPVPGEDEALFEERTRLKSSGTLLELTSRCLELLQSNMLEHLPVIRKDMEYAASLDKGLQSLSGRISSACYEVADLELGLRDYFESIPRDQERLEEINERLALLKGLQRKYGSTLEEVVAHGRKAREELAALDSLEQEIADVSREHAALDKEVNAGAEALSRARRLAAAQLQAAMQEELASLSFPQSVFEVAINSSPGLDTGAIQASGWDQVEFMFSANPGEPAKPLARIASGGELSRLMLAMKCLLARRDQVETVIFDEVDAGIGGTAAEAVARKIVELSAHHQVICITHLSQIAAWADAHFMVSKSVVNGRTVSAISTLAPEERVLELARMLGGTSRTPQTIAYARELIAGKPGQALKS